MKAIVYERYGPPDVLQLKEVDRPSPKENEVLIRVRATTVTAGDVNTRGFTFVPPGLGLLARMMFGLRKPKRQTLGIELAGEIEAVGRGVKQFKEGDQVFGIDSGRLGAYAEYKCMPEKGALAIKPANMTYDEAVAISFGGTTALHFLRRGKLQRGERVLINGASGGVGSAAVQLAKHFGAHVTGVCSTANIELVKSLGADRVIDYTRDDFTRGDETYDLILDTVVGKTSFARCKYSLKQHGRYLAVAGGMREMVQMLWTSMIGSKKVIAPVPAPVQAEDLRFLAELAQAGRFRPFIDRRYPFEQIVEAHRYVDTGRKRGNVVVTLEHL